VCDHLFLNQASCQAQGSLGLIGLPVSPTVEQCVLRSSLVGDGRTTPTGSRLGTVSVRRETGNRRPACVIRDWSETGPESPTLWKVALQPWASL
ncbi:hypothetical protein T310_9104, partial [Rasamsonia emersonii CBS 393.64]